MWVVRYCGESGQVCRDAEASLIFRAGQEDIMSPISTHKEASLEDDVVAYGTILSVANPELVVGAHHENPKIVFTDERQ